VSQNPTAAPFTTSSIPSPKSRSHTIAFAVVVGVLGIAAAGLNGAVGYLRLTFQKQPVPLRATLDDPKVGLPSRVGDWVQVSLDEPLEHDIEDALGTKQYVFRWYVNAAAVGEDRVRQFTGKSGRERLQRAGMLAMERPDAVVNVAVTYYTGLVDTVPHIPERCVVADGYLPSQIGDERWDVGTRLSDDGRIPVRFINFEDQTGRSRVPRSVAYFFQANGAYESDPLEVRRRLQHLTQRYGYFAKVELLTFQRDSAKSAETMTAFLTAALPEIERCLPNFDEYRDKKD